LGAALKTARGNHRVIFDLFSLNIFGERQWIFSHINVREMNLIEIVVECRTQEEAALIIQSQVN